MVVGVFMSDTIVQHLWATIKSVRVCVAKKSRESVDRLLQNVCRNLCSTLGHGQPKIAKLPWILPLLNHVLRSAARSMNENKVKPGNPKTKIR